MPFVRKPTSPAQAVVPPGRSLLEALASSSADERWAAARSATGADAEVATLAAALRRETEPRVREALFTSLSRIATNDSVHELLALLRTDNANLRTGALGALCTMGNVVREFLPKLLSDRDVDIRILSCELARGLPAEEATTLLCAALSNEQEPNVCAAVVEVLTEVGTVEALPVLAACSRRFSDSPFLGFAIQVASDRITASSASNRG